MSRCWLSLLLLLSPLTDRALAEQVRFLYVPVDGSGTLKQIPAGPNGSLGERFVGLGMGSRPFDGAFRPTHMVTFRSPITGQNVTVPLTLPEGTPRVETASDRIVFNYGSYAVATRFLIDGAVEVTYNSGFLRPLQPT